MKPQPPHDGLVATGELLQRAKDGDQRALEALMARYRPRLERWASGRLPSYARSLLDTQDLVQETLMKVFQGLDRVQVREPGIFQAYVRQAILNRITDQVRWARRRPAGELPEDIEDQVPSPLEQAIGIDVLQRFEDGMAVLSDDERRLVHLRVELILGYDEIAVVTERKTPDAARMATHRALRKLAKTMGDER